jgi:hypothetical protein
VLLVERVCLLLTVMALDQGLIHTIDSTVLAHMMKTLNERYNYGLELFLLSVDEGIAGYRDDSLEVDMSHYIVTATTTLTCSHHSRPSRETNNSTTFPSRSSPMPISTAGAWTRLSRPSVGRITVGITLLGSM